MDEAILEELNDKDKDLLRGLFIEGPEYKGKSIF